MFLHGFADSMHEVFIVAAVVMIPTVILSFFIKEVALRSQGGMAAARAEEDKAARAAAEGAAV